MDGALIFSDVELEKLDFFKSLYARTGEQILQYGFLYIIKLDTPRACVLKFADVHMKGAYIYSLEHADQACVDMLVSDYLRYGNRLMIGDTAHRPLDTPDFPIIDVDIALRPINKALMIEADMYYDRMYNFYDSSGIANTRNTGLINTLLDKKDRIQWGPFEMSRCKYSVKDLVKISGNSVHTFLIYSYQDMKNLHDEYAPIYLIDRKDKDIMHDKYVEPLCVFHSCEDIQYEDFRVVCHGFDYTYALRFTMRFFCVDPYVCGERADDLILVMFVDTQGDGESVEGIRDIE